MLRRIRNFLLTGFLVTCSVCALAANDLSEKLRAQAADPDLIAWIESNQIQSPGDAWDGLQRPEWMLQLVYLWDAKGEAAGSTRSKLKESTLRLFAADCAERVFPMYQRVFQNDRRPWVAIKVARLYATGKTTKSKLKAANADAVAAFLAAGEANREVNASNPNIIDYRGFEAFLASGSSVACSYITDKPNATFPSPATEPAAFYAQDPSARYIAAATSAATYAANLYTDFRHNEIAVERAWQAERMRLYFSNPFRSSTPPPLPN